MNIPSIVLEQICVCGNRQLHRRHGYGICTSEPQVSAFRGFVATLLVFADPVVVFVKLQAVSATIAVHLGENLS